MRTISTVERVRGCSALPVKIVVPQYRFFFNFPVFSVIHILYSVNSPLTSDCFYCSVSDGHCNCSDKTSHLSTSHFQFPRFFCNTYIPSVFCKFTAHHTNDRYYSVTITYYLLSIKVEFQCLSKPRKQETESKNHLQCKYIIILCIVMREK
jgi:hypothetical protein